MGEPDTFRAGLKSPAFRKLHDFWSSHCIDGRPPCLNALDLMEIYDVASDLVIIDLEGELDSVHRYRWRYAGNNLRFLVGVEMTSKYLDEIATPEMAEISDRVYGQILRTLEPHLWRQRVTIRKFDRSYVEYDRVLYPVLDRGDRPTHLIGAYDFEIADTL